MPEKASYQYIFHGYQIFFFFNLDNLEPAPGGSAPE